MKVVYWASGDDRLRAERAARAFRQSAGSRWLRDVHDNRSDAPIAHILASLSQSRRALAALVAAAGAGKRTVFTPLFEAGDLRAAPPETRSLLAACVAASDGLYAVDTEAAKALAAFAGGKRIVDLSRQSPPYEDLGDEELGPARASSGMIFFDLTTSLMSTGPPTGIARIEYDLYSTFLELAPDRIIPVAWSRQGGSFIQLPAAWRAGPTAPALLSAMESDGRAPRLDKPVAPGSQILTVGGTWARRSPYVEALAHLRLRSAAPVTVLIHDLAQTKLPELYPETAAAFRANAGRLFDVADRILVYSEATRSDVADLLVDAGPFKPIAKFRMGSTLIGAPAPRHEGQPAPVGLEACGDRSVVLYVSSIEPRKNHRMLIDAWRRLIEARGESAPILLCVGRPVMDGQRMIDEVRADPILNRHVHFATGLQDDDLDWCYRNAAFTVYPSLYEGWGLPIAESLLHGKLCIASNASSMREVAPELTDLLDSADLAAWTERITFYLDHPRELSAREERIRKEYVAYPWTSAARQVVDVMRALPSLSPPTAYVQPLTSLRLNGRDQSPLGGELLGPEWGPATQRGRATTSTESGITFTYLGTMRFAVRLHFATGMAADKVSVDVEPGTLATRVNHAANCIDLIVERPDRQTETRLRLQHRPGLVLAAIDVADKTEDLDRLRAPRKAPRGVDLLRRLAGRLRVRSRQ